MNRGLLFLLVLVAPLVALLTVAGCEQKITTVEKTEQVHESEPQMVSPGTEVVE